MTTKNFEFLYGGCYWHLPSFFAAKVFYKATTDKEKEEVAKNLAADPTFSQLFIENMMFE